MLGFAKKSGKKPMLLLAAAALVLIAASAWLLSSAIGYVPIGDGEDISYITRKGLYPKGVSALDLSGGEYSSIKGISKLKNLEELDVSGLGLSDIDEVMRCEKLKRLNICGCDISPEKYEQLHAALPQCEITWDVPLFGEIVPSDTAEYTLISQDTSQYSMLRYLSGLKALDAHGAVLCDELTELCAALPDCSIEWSVNIAGRTVESTETQLDFNDISAGGFDDFAAALGYLPNVTHVELCDSGFSNQQMEKLCEQYPYIKFVWMIHLGPWALRTDSKDFSTANTMHVSLIPEADFYQLKYCTDLIALDLGHQCFSDLTPISGLVGLKALILSDCQIKDLSPIAGLVNIEFAELMQNQISDISPLVNWKKLERVCLFRNNITDFSPLYELPKLRRVWINKNPGIRGRDSEILPHLPEGCDLCTTTRPTGQGYGWRPINYTKLGFTYSNPLNGRSPAGIEGDSYDE